jgi:hypothetical protein
MKNFFKLCTVFIFVLFLLQKANAEIVLESLKTPFPLLLNGNLTLESNKPGDFISFTFPDTVVFEKYSIKNGSKLNAELIRLNKPKRFNRHGFYEFHVTEFCTTDTNCIKLDESLKKPLYIKLYQEDVQKDKLMTNTFIEIVKFSGETVLDIVVPGVGTGLDCVDCIHKEYKKDSQHKKTCVRKVSVGLAESTYIPLVVRFLFLKTSDPIYKEGQSIPVRLEKDALEKLLGSNDNL